MVLPKTIIQGRVEKPYASSTGGTFRHHTNFNFTDKNTTETLFIDVLSALFMVVCLRRSNDGLFSAEEKEYFQCYYRCIWTKSDDKRRRHVQSVLE